MKRKKIFRKIMWYLLIIVGVCIIIGIPMSNYIIESYGNKKVYSDVLSIPYNRVGLLLGTSPTLSNGNNNLYFDYRIEAAVQLYKANKIRYIIASGDNSKNNYNEPQEMKDALIRKGIPSSAIYLDYAGFRTLDSVVRANEIFSQNSITIISQKFHNERAVYLASYFGIDAIGFNAKDVDARAGFKTKVRELFARVKVFVDLVTNKQPKYLGEKVHIPG